MLPPEPASSPAPPGPREVEGTLLLLPPGAHDVAEDVAALAGLDGFTMTSPDSLQIHDRYFDTTDARLRSRRVALRIRRNGGTLLALTEFGPSYKRAALMQSILALLGSIGALVAWLAGDGPFWAVGGLLLLFSVPFTLIVIRPTNRCLLDPGLDRSSPEADRLLTRWGRLHWARTAVSLASFGAFVLGLRAGP